MQTHIAFWYANLSESCRRVATLMADFRRPRQGLCGFNPEPFRACDVVNEGPKSILCASPDSGRIGGISYDALQILKLFLKFGAHLLQFRVPSFHGFPVELLHDVVIRHYQLGEADSGCRSDHCLKVLCVDSLGIRRFTINGFAFGPYAARHAAVTDEPPSFHGTDVGALIAECKAETGLVERDVALPHASE